MAMDRPKALMACSNYWTSPFQVGSHHLARGLVQAGWDVAFVSDPICPLDFVSPSARPHLSKRWSLYEARNHRDPDGHLWTFVPAAWVAPHNKPFFRTKWVHQSWHRTAYPNPVRLAARMGFESVDLLYVDSFSQGFWLDAIPHRHSIYRIADLNSATKRYCESAGLMERKIAQSVDHVVVPSRRLIRYAEDLGATSITYFPNGGASQHFGMANPAIPPEYRTIPKPIAVYVGVMPEWFDFESIRTAARALPHVSFVLIGPDRLAKTELKDLRNVFVLGMRAYEKLPGYLQGADVGMMPFNVREYPEIVHGLHPQKVYAYSAAGLPIVAIEWEELRSLKSPAILCHQPFSFAQGIQQALEQKPNVEQLKKFARLGDWSARVPSFLDLAQSKAA